jgi:translation initiation factor 1
MNMSADNNRRLVYSTDPKQPRCPRCGEFTPGCACVTTKKIVSPKGIIAKLRIEKAGRGGKSVTIIFDLPKDPDYLKDLAKKLKSQLGTGGTYKGEDNTVEIQGEHRERIREILSKIGFTVKG